MNEELRYIDAEIARIEIEVEQLIMSLKNLRKVRSLILAGSSDDDQLLLG